MSEYNQQCTTVEWYKWQWPKLADCIMAIPNGAHLAGDSLQRAKKMHRMKKEGFKNGVSDLMIAVPRGTYHGLWVEMKDIGKTASSVTDDQMKHLQLMRKMGYRAEWCAGADAAMQVIAEYMNQGT